MIYKKMKLDTVMFAAAMVTVSGACLAYNIKTVNETELTASFSELAAVSVTESNAVSYASAANLEYRDAVAVSAIPNDGTMRKELLPPIVVPNDG